MRDEIVNAAREQPYRVQTLRCRRTDWWILLDGHKQCPYCFGTAEDVETGIHARFCGYQPDRDPVHFGFPGGMTRDVEG